MAPSTTPYQEDMPMQITLSNVRYTYPGATEPILNNVNVTFPQGWSGLLGDNGCGKTTLARNAKTVEWGLPPFDMLVAIFRCRSAAAFQ